MSVDKEQAQRLIVLRFKCLIDSVFLQIYRARGCCWIVSTTKRERFDQRSGHRAVLASCVVSLLAHVSVFFSGFRSSHPTQLQWFPLFHAFFYMEFLHASYQVVLVWFGSIVAVEWKFLFHFRTVILYCIVVVIHVFFLKKGKC